MRAAQGERRAAPRRIAVDLDGTLADLGTVLQREVERLFGPGVDLRDDGRPDPESTAAAQPSGRRLSQAEIHQLWSHVCGLQDFWTTLEEIEPGTVARLATMASRHRWEVIFLTKRPATQGETAQIQTQRWLQRHGFELPSVYVITSGRGKLAAALALDVLLDDDAENCIEVATESNARPLLVRRDSARVPLGAAGLGILTVFSMAEALDSIEQMMLSPAGAPGVVARLREALGV